MDKYRNTLLLVIIALLSLPVFAQDAALENLRQTGKAFASVARQVSPSVVFIQVESKRASASVSPFSSPFGEQWPFGDDLFRRFFGEPLPGVPKREPPQEQPRAVSQGSGFVFATEQGLLLAKTFILTNNHVVEGAQNIRVKFQDGREYDAEITGRDPQSDVAVIEIKGKNIPVLQLGDSSKLEVGEWVVAIGSPFGLSHTLTVGVVSATGRTRVGITDYEDFIQTDAAINPGNSGGPLVNLSGEVVGMNTAIFSRSGGYMGIGFAIPINMAKKIANQLMDKGEVTRGYLGIVIQALTPELAESFDIKQKGIIVAEVAADSAAAKAGLRQGDVIVAYGDKPVTDVGDFRNQVSLTPPGQKNTLTIIRDGKRQILNVTIGKRNSEQTLAKAPTQQSDELGLTVQTISPALAQQFNLKAGEGVVVTQVKQGSIAALAGINEGTVILQVNRNTVKTAAAFQDAVKRASGDKRVLLLIRKGESQQYVVLRW